MNILNNPKPFAHFNSYIHNSNYREDWFKFRNSAYEKQVREMIYDKLNEDDEWALSFPPISDDGNVKRQ